MPSRSGAAALLAALLAGASGAVLALPPGHASFSASSAQPAQKKAWPAPIDVNSASPAQLKKLPGIGDAEVERIIAGRPYPSKAELVTRQVIPHGVYLSIKDRIMARQSTRRAKARA